MTDLQGAVGVVQLKKLDLFIDERAKWAAYYYDKLKEIKWLRLPNEDKNYKHGWQSYVTFVDESKIKMSRNEIMEYLQQRGISTRPGTHAVHMLKYYKDNFNLKADDFPGARDANNFSMAIPLHNRMNKDDYDFIIQSLTGL
jgi:perosamine synthetase